MGDARAWGERDAAVVWHGFTQVLGDEARAMAAADDLLDQALLVPAIRPPTVPAGTSRLRIALSAAHTDDQLDRLATALHTLGEPGGGGPA